MATPNRTAIINRGLELLRAGLLPSVLHSALMTEFGLTVEKAQELANDAIKLFEEKKEPGADLLGNKE